MKLIYSNDYSVDSKTFKRLLLLGNEICFMDRPTVVLDDSGGITGDRSPMREFNNNLPVKITVYDEPSHEEKLLYSLYLKADFSNIEFVRTVYEGLKNDPTFLSRFILLDSSYDEHYDDDEKKTIKTTGKMIYTALINTFYPEIVIGDWSVDRKYKYKIDSQEGRRETFKIVLTEASIQITEAMLVSSKYSGGLISNNPYFSRLISLRYSHPKYVFDKQKSSMLMNLELFKSVVPDEILERIEIDDVMEFREKTKEMYAELAVILKQVEEKIYLIGSGHLQQEDIKKILDTEFMAKTQILKNEMVSIRDRLFGELLGKIKRLEYPTLCLSNVGLNTAYSISSFLTLSNEKNSDIENRMKENEQISNEHCCSLYTIGLST